MFFVLLTCGLTVFQLSISTCSYCNSFSSCVSHPFATCAYKIRNHFRVLSMTFWFCLLLDLCSITRFPPLDSSRWWLLSNYIYITAEKSPFPELVLFEGFCDLTSSKFILQCGYFVYFQVDPNHLTWILSITNANTKKKSYSHSKFINNLKARPMSANNVHNTNMIAIN